MGPRSRTRHDQSHQSRRGISHMRNTYGASRRLAAAAGVALSAIAVFGMAGCGPKNNRTVPSSGSPTCSTRAPSTTSTGAQFDIGNTINYGSLGTTTTLDCGDGKSLNVGGSNNTLTDGNST